MHVFLGLGNCMEKMRTLFEETSIIHGSLAVRYQTREPGGSPARSQVFGRYPNGRKGGVCSKVFGIDNGELSLCELYPGAAIMRIVSICRVMT